ncbi:MAG: DsbA family oxidoreductase [Mycobacteriaceae bacterium]
MRIEIWSDVVCPWCYIGKRRLEQALEQFEHPVEIVYRSFQLDPAAPREATQTVAEHLGSKYGGGAQGGQQMIDRIEGVAAQEGLLFRMGLAQRGNTFDAHRLLHLALTYGPDVQGRLKEELLAAYFLRAENVADHDVLVRAAGMVDIEEARARRVLDGSEFSEDVEADIRRASALGATGVPFYVVDGSYGVSGAQPSAVFTQVLQRAWDDAHPTLEMVGGLDASVDACGPDGCAV